MRKRYSRSYTVLSFLTMFSYRELPFTFRFFAADRKLHVEILKGHCVNVILPRGELRLRSVRRKNRDLRLRRQRLRNLIHIFQQEGFARKRRKPRRFKRACNVFRRTRSAPAAHRAPFHFTGAQRRDDLLRAAEAPLRRRFRWGRRFKSGGRSASTQAY